LLRHDPRVCEIRAHIPVVLHCASLSLGGSLPCPVETLDQIRDWVDMTETPWIGEHLAFITASRHEAGPVPQPCAPDEPYNIGYTVSPPMNEHTLKRTCRNLQTHEKRFGVPLLVENSPLYFEIPTSTMTQAEFLHDLCARTNVGLLLDLSHFYITSKTMNFDPLTELERLPLDRVVEVHISGIDEQAGGLWDDHANPAPSIVYQLLARMLEFVTPKAITLEYNWSLRFPAATLIKELQTVRDTVRNHHG
jgi:uncharacterized protein